MAAPHPELIAWIDTETTGLDPHRDELLEIALVITDNDLNEIGNPAHVLIRTESINRTLLLMNPFVRDMHTSNGLIDALRTGAGMGYHEADQHIARAIDDVAGGIAPLILGGNSITHDRGFLQAQAPETFGRLHYRSIDVTSIEIDMARDGHAEQIEQWRKDFTPTDGHRALGDIRDSIRQLRALRAIRAGAVARA